MTASLAGEGILDQAAGQVVDLGALDWELTRTVPGEAVSPDELEDPNREWIAASVPGTAYGAMLSAGRVSVGDALDTDASDWWWRARLTPEPAGRFTLEADGIATVSEVWVGGERVATSGGMFTRFAVDIEIPEAGTQLFIACRALAPLLATRRPRPQWKTRLVQQQNLRWFRTTFLGRMPGWSPSGAPVGPWRPVRLYRPAQPRVVQRLVQPRCVDEGGEVAVDVTLALPAMPSRARLQVVGAASGDEAAAELSIGSASSGDGGSVEARLTGAVRLPSVQRWWPFGYGPQALYAVTLDVDGTPVELGRIGFREFVVDRSDGAFSPYVNGVPVFLPGACWVPPGGVALQASDEQVRDAVRAARDAGLRMIRVTGTTVYEAAAFWDACDELGVLVWQDAMIANLPMPDTEEFTREIVAELTQTLGDLSGRPALAVVCGGSEVEQQAAMLGLPAERRALPLLVDTFPRVVAELTPTAEYVTSSPTGGEPPFRPDQGVAHYFGVSAYLRPLSDARLTGLRFAAECLAFANPPEPFSVEEAFGSSAPAGHAPQWKRGVPRDAGAPWDFEDVRDVYVEEFFGVNLRRLRFTDSDRYLDLGRAAVAEIMRRTMGEWRRGDSGCGGALILNLTDLVPGPGWGLRDCEGRPKSAWYALRQVCAPLAVHIVDEGMSGLGIWMWNDAPREVAATVEVTLYAGGQTPVGSASRGVTLPAHGEAGCEVEELLGAFRDVGWTYRFGPPSADVVQAVLRTEDGREVTDVFLPAGPARDTEPEIGLAAAIVELGEDECRAEVATRRFAQFVAFDANGWTPDDAWFHLAPGQRRTVRFVRGSARGGFRGEVRALNSVARAPLR